MKKDSCSTVAAQWLYGAILSKKGAQLPTSASMDNDDLDLNRPSNQ